MLPKRKTHGTEQPHREGQVEGRHRQVGNRIMMTILSGILHLHGEVQVKDNLRIKGQSGGVDDRQTFSITGLGITGKTTSGSRGGSPHYLFFTKGIYTDHRRKGIARKNT